MNLDFKGKVVGITGGSTGIGEAVAWAFAKEGAKVAVCGRSQGKLDALKEKFEEKGYPLYTESADVGNLRELERFVKSVAREYGRIDIWINNAGINNRKSFEAYSEEDFDSLISVNLKSVFFGTHYVAEEMRKTGGGVILNTSSFAALIPSAGIALYSATKAAVSNLTKTLSVELAPDHIRVCSVIPGVIETPLTTKNLEKNRESLVSNIAMRKLGAPEDLVGAYLFLASDDIAGYINGVDITVAGGKFCAQDCMWGWKQHEST